MSLPAPEPAHILRFHTDPITCITISQDNERIYAGDAAGNVTISSPLSLRRLADWKAHKESVLGVQEWNDKVIT
jgi:ASTRA-associated protein 1